jgi:hypothetical protein
MDASRQLKRGASVGDSPKWEKAAEFPARPSAEFARQLLEAEGIPVALLQDQTGIFGPGFSGPSALGVRVLVPTGMVEEAREILADTLEAFGGNPE